jgi:predicted small lipoprotein YifL
VTFCLRSNLYAAAVVAALALSLSGCGRRGALEPPPGAPPSNAPLTGRPDEYRAPTNFVDFPRANTVGAVGTTGAAGAAPLPLDPEEPDKPSAPAAKPPPKPFLLDPLL